MKLLFDQNLSFKLSQAFSDLFPASTQVRLLGLCSSISRGSRTIPPILCDSSEAKLMVGDFSGIRADIAIEPKAGRVPIRAGLAVPMPIG
jgi:hypothetical protein